jgi:curli biogenesis system outer membrane secretion channel CsgG
VVTFFVAATSGCASSGAGALVLPSNWNDRYLERQAQKQSMKTAVAVLPFDVDGGIRNVDLKVADIVATSLFKTGRFEIVERERINAIVEEQKLKLSGMIDDSSKAAELGQMVGAEAVVVGTLSVATQQRVDKFAYDQVNTEVRIDVRVVDTSTGKAILSESADGKSEAKIVTTANGVVISGALDVGGEFNKAAAKAADGVGNRLGALFPVVGYVVATNGKEVISDVGASCGIQAGARLIVFRAGDRINHPVTKKPIGWQKTILGRLEVKSADQTSSVSVVESGESNGIRPGDVVVLQP